MFYWNKDTELDILTLQKMINRFILNDKPRLEKYKNYYDGLQAILNKSYKDESKPCNKTVLNYCFNIANSYNGYLATPDFISYSSNDDIEDIMNILRYNDYQEQDNKYCLDLLVYGKAAELMYLDNDAQTRFRLINPLQCFAVYDDTLSSDLLYFVRMYKVNDWDDSDLYNVDVYGDISTKHYTMQGVNGYLTYKGETANYFSQCPANVAYMPDEKSIFDCIMSQQDSVNELLSAEIDDYAAFCDAYLALVGVDADSEDIAAMKENRVMILPDDATVNYVTKAANDMQIENILKRLHDSIYRIAQCPDFSSETFVGGVSSGVAIKYRLTGMENRAGGIEAILKKAFQRRVEIICGIASLKLGVDVFRDIKIDFKRNIPTDNTEIISLVNALKGTVSDKTLLSQLPFVDDVNAELKALQEQKAANMALYDFGGNVDNEDEETE